jgi:hypothetical protein
LNFTKLNQSNPDVYSPPHVVGAERFVIAAGGPDQAYISSSLFERQNLTMRMSLRRFTRLMNASSKNLRAGVSLHVAHYNFGGCIRRYA